MPVNEQSPSARGAKIFYLLILLFWALSLVRLILGAVAAAVRAGRVAAAPRAARALIEYQSHYSHYPAGQPLPALHCEARVEIL